MISFDETIRLIASAAQPIGREVVPLDQAAGRVLAEPVIAAIDSPRADVSAMDGYAVRSGDLGVSPVALRVIGESVPGAGSHVLVEPGTCVRIFTGGPIPSGADGVVIQERVTRDGELARIEADPGPARWVRRKGGDFAAGDTILRQGLLIDPAALIAAAGADLAAVTVARRPRVMLLSTGDELVEPGRASETPLAVPDSVGPGITALASRWGGDVVGHVRLRDDLEALQAAAAKAVEEADVVVVSGGASVGERDFAKAMFNPLGMQLLFSKVAIRPGMPVWFGRSNAALILGLPGNPTSALITARLFLAPLLALLQGRPIEEALDWEPARLSGSLPACDSRETFHRAILRGGEAMPVEFQESHAQRALAQSNALIRQAAGSAEIAPGKSVWLLRL